MTGKQLAPTAGVSVRACDRTGNPLRICPLFRPSAAIHIAKIINSARILRLLGITAKVDVTVLCAPCRISSSDTISAVVQAPHVSANSGYCFFPGGILGVSTTLQRRWCQQDSNSHGHLSAIKEKHHSLTPNKENIGGLVRTRVRKKKLEQIYTNKVHVEMQHKPASPHILCWHIQKQIRKQLSIWNCKTGRFIVFLGLR